jgi:hypothetical protein
MSNNFQVLKVLRQPGLSQKRVGVIVHLRAAMLHLVLGSWLPGILAGGNDGCF